MRLASYNVENLFDRARVMNLENWAQGKPTLDRFSALDALLGKASYSAADKDKMAALAVELGLEKSDTAEFVVLRQNKGKLLKRPRGGGVEIVADGRADWVGSLELRDEPISEVAAQNTARAIKDLGADVLAVVEVESRPALSDFSARMLPPVGGAPYRHAMLIDGNDERGIDVGLLTRDDYPISVMRSHVDERLANGSLVFSRDCAEYEVETPAGGRILLMINHFKSKGFGSPAASNARRRAQAERVAEIYRARAAAYEHIAVLGDFNDTPDSEPLQPLLKGADLTDVFKHPAFDDGGFAGTFGACRADNKIDYILLSPKLFEKVKAGGVFRKGVWPGVRPVKWAAYEEMLRPVDAASDHAAVWAEIDI